MTERPVGPELADVLQRYEEPFMATYGRLLNRQQRRVWRDIVTCRTEARGGHELVCDSCGTVERSYNSCRNRHCPKCLNSARGDWVEARQEDLLPVPYFHVVFTLPDQLSGLALQNKEAIYNLLFSSASQALLELAADQHRLGAETGFLAILHTWGQTLNYHPHIHCVVPAGGFSADRKRWVYGKAKFYIHTRPLGDRFRNLFIQGLRELKREKKLEFHGQLKPLEQRQRFERFYNNLKSFRWIVYAKPPFGSSGQVLKYLSRYTHRVAISNRRIQCIDNGQVRFSYKDYRDQSKIKSMTLAAPEFIRRFFTHSLPKGYKRIRYYGWMSSANRSAALTLARKLLAVPDDIQSAVAGDENHALWPCPHCKTGSLSVIAEFKGLSSLYFNNST